MSSKEKRIPVTTNYRGIINVGIFALVFLFGGLIAWMSWFVISGAVVASGSVAVKGKPKMVQHLDGGVIAAINVVDGQTVKQGDIVVRLDDTIHHANLLIYRNRLRESVALRARLEAERSEREHIAWLDDFLQTLKIDFDKSVRTGQQKLFEARRSTLNGQVQLLNEKIAQFNNQINGVEALKESKKRQIELIGRELEGVRKLFKQGNTTQRRLLELERESVRLIGEQAEHDAQLARIRNSIKEMNVEILQSKRKFREQVLTELRTTTVEINDLVQQLYATRQKLNRIEIRAPVSGVIHELAVHTVGGVIAAGATVMQIVPQDEAVEIEVAVEPQFIDDLFIGQEASVRFTAFNQRTTPQLNGKVVAISPASTVNQTTGMAYYQVRVGIGDEELTRLGQQKLVPGMPVETFMRKTDRTVLSYLMRPLTDQIYRAFRED